MPRDEFPPIPTSIYSKEFPISDGVEHLIPLIEQAADQLIINGVYMAEYATNLSRQLEAIALLAQSTKEDIRLTLARIVAAYQRGDYAEGVRLADELLATVGLQVETANYGFMQLLRELSKLSPPSVRQVAEQQNKNFNDEPLFSADLTNEGPEKKKRSLVSVIKSRVHIAYQGWLRNDDTR